MGKPLTLKPPIVREHPLQAQISRLLTLEIARPGKVSRAGVVWFSLDIASYSEDEIARTWAARGVVAGVPDIFLMFRGRVYCVELKAEDGAVSAAQQSLAIAITVAGGRVGFASSAEEMLAIIDEWRIPRNKRTML